jgi:hypothetical protein
MTITELAVSIGMMASPCNNADPNLKIQKEAKDIKQFLERKRDEMNPQVKTIPWKQGGSSETIPLTLD